jgi:hypothetical protein
VEEARKIWGGIREDVFEAVLMGKKKKQQKKQIDDNHT